MCIVKKISVVLGGLLISSSLYAESFPTEPVRLIVGFTAGSTTDLLARVIGDGLSQKYGVPFIVENRPGANGVLGAQTVARAKPDGHTLLVTNSSSITVNPLLYKNLQYDSQNDFVGITPLISAPFTLSIHKENERLEGVESLSDLIELARTQPEQITFGSAGNGNLMHLAGERLGVLTDTTLNHIPYKSGVQAETALLAKEIDFSFVTMASLPMIKAGRLQPLAVSTTERWSELPEVPTIAELGYPDFDISFWIGVLAPAGTPEAIVNELNAQIQTIATNPTFSQRLATQGTVTVMSPEQFKEKIATEITDNKELIQKAKIPIVN